MRKIIRFKFYWSDNTFHRVLIADESFYKDCGYNVWVDNGITYGIIDFPKNSIFYNLNCIYVNKMKFMEDFKPKCIFETSSVSEELQINSYFFSLVENQINNYTNLDVNPFDVRGKSFVVDDYIEACKKLIDIMTSDYIDKDINDSEFDI